MSRNEESDEPLDPILEDLRTLASKIYPTPLDERDLLAMFLENWLFLHRIEQREQRIRSLEEDVGFSDGDRPTFGNG